MQWARLAQSVQSVTTVLNYNNAAKLNMFESTWIRDGLKKHWDRIWDKIETKLRQNWGFNPFIIRSSGDFSVTIRDTLAHIHSSQKNCLLVVGWYYCRPGPYFITIIYGLCMQLRRVNNRLPAAWSCAAGRKVLFGSNTCSCVGCWMSYVGGSKDPRVLCMQPL